MHEDKVRHYSDAGELIVQLETMRIYEEAVDAVPCRFTYKELTEELVQEISGEGDAENRAPEPDAGDGEPESGTENSEPETNAEDGHTENDTGDGA